MRDQVDAVLHEALVTATGGLDLDVAQGAITDAVAALGLQAKALREGKYRRRVVTKKCECGKVVRVVVGVDPVDIARAMGQTGKVTDGMVRLMAFAKGQPDSRPEGGVAGVLSVLTEEELRTVEARWRAKGG